MRVRPDPEARPRRRAGDRVRRRDERIRAVVEVEQRPLRALEQHALAVAERSVDEQRRVGDVRRAAAAAKRLVARRDLLERRTARARRRARARRSSRRARARSSGAGSSGRAGPGRGCRCAPPCRRRPARSRAASCRSAACPSRRSLAPSSATCHGMIRCALPETTDEASRRDARAPRARRAPRSAPRVDDAAGADHARACPRGSPTGSARILYVSPSTTIVWPGVRPALVAADEVGVLREQVDDLALALVAPLRADDHGRGHARQSCTRPLSPPSGRARAPPVAGAESSRPPIRRESQRRRTDCRRRRASDDDVGVPPSRRSRASSGSARRGATPPTTKAEPDAARFAERPEPDLATDATGVRDHRVERDDRGPLLAGTTWCR